MFEPDFDQDAEDAMPTGEEGAEEEFCYYCGEPLDEDGMCSAACADSAADEGREEEEEE